jgi:hypothetical protein
MEIVTLPPGKSAEVDNDCIRIQELPEGGFMLEGSALVACGDSDPAESISLIDGQPYASYDEAEAAGIAWASDHCVAVLHVSRSKGTEPLPDPAV